MNPFIEVEAYDRQSKMCLMINNISVVKPADRGATGTYIWMMSCTEDDYFYSPESYESITKKIWSAYHSV